MLTSTTPTASATAPTVPGVATPPPATAPGATTPVPAIKPEPTKAVEPQLAPQPVPSTQPKPTTAEKMSPLMLWYAVSVYAYAAAFHKTVENIIAEPDGKGLFPMEQDVSQPVQATKENQFSPDIKAFFDLNGAAIDDAINHTDMDKNGNPLTAAQKTEAKSSAKFEDEIDAAP